MRGGHSVFPCEDDHDRLGECDTGPPHCGCSCHDDPIDWEQVKVTQLRQHNHGKKRPGQHERRCKYCQALDLIDNHGYTFEQAWQTTLPSVDNEAEGVGFF